MGVKHLHSVFSELSTGGLALNKNFSCKYFPKYRSKRIHLPFKYSPRSITSSSLVLNLFSLTIFMTFGSGKTPHEFGVEWSTNQCETFSVTTLKN